MRASVECTSKKANQRGLKATWEAKCLERMGPREGPLKTDFCLISRDPELRVTWDLEFRCLDDGSYDRS